VTLATALTRSGSSGPPWMTACFWSGYYLVATIAVFAPSYAAEPITLKVEAIRGLPGLPHSALSRFLAAHMAEVGLADWRFAPAAGDASAPDRVEWTIRLNPYAGGEVRNFVHTLFHEQRLGVHRPVTIEARLHLNGQYQTLVLISMASIPRWLRYTLS